MSETRGKYPRLDQLAFVVHGIPRPKQSFKVSGCHGYTPQLVKDWQTLVAAEASLAMQGRDPFAGQLTVVIDFYLPDRRRRDLDNLSKGVLDACNGIVWLDDQQIISLTLCKFYQSPEYGCTVTVSHLGE